MNHYTEHAPQLAELGYDILPIQAGEKYFKGKNWPNVNYDPDSKAYCKPTKSYGVGVKTRLTPAVDIDTTDQSAINHMDKVVADLIGLSPRRIGRAPRAAMVYRTDKPFQKKCSARYEDGNGEFHKVEILGDGQQLVMFHVHPDTGKPYTWNESPWPVPELPTITEDQAIAICRAFDAWVKANTDWEQKSPSRLKSHGGDLDDLDDHTYSNKQLTAPTDLTRSEIEQILSYIDPDVDYDEWLVVCMALKSTGENWARGMFIEWSKGGEKYDSVEVRKKFDEDVAPGTDKGKPITIGTLVHLAKENGFNAVEPTLKVESLAELPKQATGKIRRKTVFPPGLVGEIAEFAMVSAPRPDREYALAAALTSASVLSGNRYYIEIMGTGLNGYILTVGLTGSGKAHLMFVVRAIAEAAGVTGTIAEGVSSGVALVRALADSPGKDVFYWQDEVWNLLEAVNSKSGSSHVKDLVSTIMQLYDRARGSFSGRKYAQSKDNIEPIDRPYLVFGGATTPERFVKALTDTQVVDGFLNRTIVIQSDAVPPINFKSKRTVPDKLRKALQQLAFAGYSLEPEDMVAPADIPVVFGDGSFALFEQFSLVCDGHLTGGGRMSSLWARGFENALRIAGVVAVGVDPQTPVISTGIANWAIDEIQYRIGSLGVHLEEHMAESVYDEQVNKVMACVRNPLRFSKDSRWGPWCAKGVMPRGKILGVVRGLSAKVLDGMEQTLVETRAIKVVKVDKVRCYVLFDFIVPVGKKCK